MLSSFECIRLPLDLNGAWRMRRDADGCAEYGVFPGEESLWRPVTLPADIPHCLPEQDQPHGVFWFRRRFELPAEHEGRRICVHFDAVNFRSSVFINGQYTGGFDQGYLPFDVDITDAARPGETNEIIVRVDDRRRPGELPTNFYWRNCGGILRDVTLYSLPDAHITDMYVQADAGGQAKIFAELTGVTGEHALELSICDAEGRCLYSHTCAARAHQCITHTLPDAKLWDFDSPNLYRACLALNHRGKTIDKMSRIFGFREIRAENGAIWLNGREVFLKGFNRHEDHPLSGSAACEQAIREDFARIKASGANFVRMCHYPHDERELEEADRLGLGLLVEIPLCAYPLPVPYGLNGEGAGDAEVVYDNARKCLLRMISRDRSHPSVLIYSVSNETEEPDEKVIRINESLIRQAKRADPTRLCVHVSNHARNSLREQFFREDDVICVNTYRSIYWRICKRDDAYDLNEAGKEIAQMIGELKELYPDKPVIITEFGYRENDSFDGPDDAECMKKAVCSELLGLSANANGATVWLFADHLWERGCMTEVSNYGLLNRDRSKKAAFDAYADILSGL